MPCFPPPSVASGLFSPLWSFYGVLDPWIPLLTTGIGRLESQLVLLRRLLHVCTLRLPTSPKVPDTTRRAVKIMEIDCQLLVPPNLPTYPTS